MSTLLIGGLHTKYMNNFNKIITDANNKAKNEKTSIGKWTTRNKLVVNDINKSSIFWVSEMDSVVKKFLKYFTNVYYSENLIEQDDGYFLIS